MVERVLGALRDLPPVDVAILVTHGGTSGRLLELLLELGPEHRRVFGPLGNCAWSELARQSGRWRLVRHNSSAGPLPEGLSVPAAERLRVDRVPGTDRADGGDRPVQDADAVG